MIGIGPDGHDWEADEADVLEQSQNVGPAGGLPDDAVIPDGRPEADVVEQLLPGNAGGTDEDYPPDDDRSV